MKASSITARVLAALVCPNCAADVLYILQHLKLNSTCDYKCHLLTQNPRWISSTYKEGSTPPQYKIIL
jgi:hypothetical protein